MSNESETRGGSCAPAPCSANDGKNQLEAFKAGAMWAAEIVEGKKTYYRFARGVGQSNEGPHNHKLTEIKQAILAATEQLRDLPNDKAQALRQQPKL